MLGVVLAIGILSITALAYREMRAGALEAARSRLGSVGRELSRLFETSGRGRIAIVQRGANHPTVAEYLKSRKDPASTEAILTSVLPEDASTIELWDSAGARLLHIGASRPPISDSITTWLRGQVSLASTGAITPLYMAGDSVRYAVLAAVPVDGRILGYVVQRQPVAVSKETRDQLSALVGSNSQIFVGNSDGTVWTDFIGHAERPPVAIIDSTLLSYTRPGTRGQFAVARSMNVVPWTVLVEFPREDVLSRSEAFLRHAGIASALLIGLVGLGGLYSTRRVVRPLEETLASSEGALASSEARFRAVVEGAPNGIVMVDRHGKIVLANAEVERIFGYAQPELLGQAIEKLVPTRVRDGHPALRGSYQANPEHREMGAGRDLFGVRKDGTEVPVEIGINPVERDGERFVVASVVDISARKEAELELRRSNEELQRFAYVASHDLQEPLRTVASYVQLLERRYKDKLDQDAKEFIEFAVDGARRMQRLVEDLLALSRVGSRGLDLVPVKADDVLDAVVADLELSIKETSATIERAPLPEIRGDFRQMQQLFTNLIGNAIKFRGDAPPRIEVSARRDGSNHVFSVRDHGIGIEPQYYERIFVIFQRLHGREEYPGTGIGLAICKKIIERHGGRIWVESEPGNGSTFFFTLPVNQEA